MKRIFAILLASMVLTACSEKGEVAVEEITVTEVVTEEATTVTTEETMAVTMEETMESTTAETSAVTEVYAEKASFPTGYWMNYIERPDYTDRKSYTFNDDGTYRISMEMHDIYDKYTFSDNVLTMTFDLSEQGWGTYRFSFDVTEDNGNYILKYKSEEIDGNMPDVQTVTQTSDQELIVQLENLFSDYRNEEMLCFEKY